MEPAKGGICSSLSCLLLVLPASQTSSRPVVGALGTGVVVERVLPHSEAEKAGIQEGDVVLRWVCGDVHGEIHSPFDLDTAEIEQAPRGNVMLEGLRGKEKSTWQLGQDRWGIQVRPNFPDAILTLYRTGQDFATAGKLSEAAEKWRLIANQGDSSNPQWLLFHLAGLQADARHWQEADQSYQEALQISAANPDVVVEIHMAWGRSFAQRNDWEHAGEHFGQAMVIARAMGDNGLTLAIVLDELGSLAQKQGDIKKAEEYYRQALGIQEKVAPDSLDVAQSLNRLGDMEENRGNLVQSEDYFTRALAIGGKQAPGGLDVSGSLMGLGLVAFDRDDFAGAETYFGRALAIREKREPGSLDVALSLNNLGRVADRRDDQVSAENYYRRALAIREKLAPGSLDVASTIHNLGILADNRGDLRQAEQYLLQALGIREKLAPDSLMLAFTLNGLGNVSSDRGNLSNALEYYGRALEIREKRAPGSVGVATTVGNLGLMAFERGDLAMAEGYYRQALKITEKVAPEGLGLALILNNLGNVELDRGNQFKAQSYCRQALAIREKRAPGSLVVAVSLGDLGQAAFDQGDMAKAVAYNLHALEIKEKIAPDSLYVARSLSWLGAFYIRRADFLRAEGYLKRALAIQQRVTPLSRDTALSLNRLSEIQRHHGDLDAAEQSLRRALELWKSLAPGSGERAEVLAGLASIRRRQGRLEEAAQFYAQALDAVEAQTARLGGTTDIRADFRAKRGNYRQYMGVLLAQGKPEAAFEVLERSRARILLEILASAHVDIRKGASPELLKKERSLQADIKAKSERRVHLLTANKSEEQVKAVEKEISTLTAEYQDVEAQIRSSSPAYAALMQPRPLSAKEIQQQSLDADTVLLEYSLEEPRSHVFMVSSSSLEAFALPKRALIEAASRRVYELLTARNRRPKGEKPRDRLARITRADSEFPHAATQLSRMVLGPVAGKLANKRLLVVSDGALNYVPFAALPIAAPGQAAGPLAARHEVVNLPSASVLAVLRRERQGRPVAAKTVAVLADPVFDSGDLRVKQSLAAGSRQDAEPTRDQARLQAVPAVLQDGAGQKDGEGKDVAERSNGRVPSSSTTTTAAAAQEEDNAEGEESLESARLTRSAADVGWKGTQRGEVYLPRLRSTRREAEAIVATAPAGKSFEALDFKANRATATSADLENYRIVHFATHALLNSKHPELSGLVLSLVNERGRPQSGFLGLEDIYNLNLPVDLVVLSACETALGKDVEGEGMMGLTRGFMYAGASRVVASLWDINDQATAEQIRHFYKAMLGQGMRPAAALRSAQLKLRQERRWNSPYFWAAFQIQGEWK